jgi:hypothetical protein
MPYSAVYAVNVSAFRRWRLESANVNQYKTDLHLLCKRSLIPDNIRSDDGLTEQERLGRRRIKENHEFSAVSEKRCRS